MDQEKFQNISSRQNQWVKKLVQLRRKKTRDQYGQFVVENAKIIRDALHFGADFVAFFVASGFLESNSDLIKEICDLSKSDNLFLLDNTLNDYFSSLDTPSGIAAVYEIKKEKLTKGSVIYLNGVGDPGNLGAIMRSALAFGFNNIVLDKACVDAYNPKVISAAKDAIFKINFMKDDDGKWLEDYKLPIYATSSHQGTGLVDFASAREYCLVFGSESHGVEKGIMSKADEIIRIEMPGEMESLNVASSAAILFYSFSLRK